MRDLQKDLEICQAATPGPWVISLRPAQYAKRSWICATGCAEIQSDAPNSSEEANAVFIASAREGWPEAIRRAIAAEARIQELEAQCAAMREVLEWILPGAMSVFCMYDDCKDADPNFHCCDWSEAVDKIRQVLSANAGRDLLERMKAAEVKAKELEDELLELAADVWLQWGLMWNGKRDSGGLTTLEIAEDILREAGKIDEKGRFAWEYEQGGEQDA